MNIFTNFKVRFLKALRTNLSLAIYSFLIAVLTWTIISVAIYPSIPKNFDNLKLSLDISGSTAEANGLILTSCSEEKVSVKLEGDRLQVGSLKAEDLTARLVIDNISSPGSRRLSIEVVSNNGKVFTVKNITPNAVMVDFDRLDTREFELTPDIPNIKFAKDKMHNREDMHCEPSKVKITGPSSMLDKIDKCLAVTNKELELDSTNMFDYDEIKLLNSSGTVIENELFDIEKKDISIIIPVFTQKTVRLSVSIVNVPPNFNKDSIKLTLSEEEILIASEESNPEFPETLDIGKISLSDLDLNYSKSFPIDLKGFTNLSNVDSVTVTLANENLVKKNFTINDFPISNKPPNYDFNVATKTLVVPIVGPADIIGELTARDIVANVDLLGYTADADSFRFPVTVSCLTHDDVWGVSNASVTVQRTRSEE